MPKGTLLQLIAKGERENILTGNPEVTFFKKTFKRYTNFAFESIRQEFKGTTKFGNRVECKLDKVGDLSHINEKPKYDFLINTGLYILNPNVLKIIPKNKFYHITHLIEDAKNKGKKIGVFPINEDAWIDVGQWAEYKNVVDRL